MFQHHKSGKYPQGQFPHFTAEEAAAQKLRAPIHGHTACKRQTQEARPRLQVQAVSSALTLSPRGSRAAPTQGSPAWPGHSLQHPLPPTSVTDGARRIRGGARDGSEGQSQGWSHQLWSPPGPLSPGPLPPACGHTDGQASGFPSPILTCLAL